MMPMPLKYEIYEVVETRGDGVGSRVRDVQCFYRVADGELLWMRDPLLGALIYEQDSCAAVKRSGGRYVGYACNRPKGHQGLHAALTSNSEAELYLQHAWDDADCRPASPQGDGAGE